MTHSMRPILSTLAGLPLLAIYALTLIVLAVVIWTAAAVGGVWRVMK